MATMSEDDISRGVAANATSRKKTTQSNKPPKAAKRSPKSSGPSQLLSNPALSSRAGPRKQPSTGLILPFHEADGFEDGVFVVGARGPSSGMSGKVPSDRSRAAGPSQQVASSRGSGGVSEEDEEEAVGVVASRGAPDVDPAGSSSRKGTGRTRAYPSVWLRLPNTSFGISMGLAGQAIMWKVASGVDFLSTKLNTELLSAGFWIASLVIGVVLVTAYSLKAVFFFPLVKDEYNDGSRIHFFNMPHLIMMMLAISVPESNLMNVSQVSRTGEMVIWTIGFVIQTLFTQHIYESWLFSEVHNISCARPQFLLSTVGWFFLATLGTIARIEEKWGLALPTFCFGFGMMLYIMVVISIFNGIHSAPKAKGSPALFLLIAPPSAAVVAWDLISNGGPGNFADMSALLLGFCLGIFLLLVRIGPQILSPPPSLGAYWAYVFPMSALAAALVRYAWAVGTKASEVLAIVFVALSMLALLVVFIRMTTHMYHVYAGNAEWEDPLLSPQRLAAVSAVVYSELMPNYETA